MTLELTRSADFLRMVDAEKGTVDRQIFSDEQIYQIELEKIFARAWNFMAHESQIPNVGDFFQTLIGEDRVIVVRDKEGGVQVLLNTCRHRGNAVCRAEEGRASSFMCTYHGWTYDLKGALVGVPGFKDYYHEDLKREEWGLITAAQVDSYKGFVFATLDSEAVPLEEFLGDVGRISIDLIAERGNVQIVAGIQKYVIGCNWKLAVDNIWDYYHPQITHASSNMARWNRYGRSGQTNPAQANLFREHLVILGEYGHAIGGPAWTEASKQSPFIIDESWREKESAKKAMGPVGIRTNGHPNLFPNMWITESGQISMRMPKGPWSTEIWWFTLIDRDLPEEKYQAYLHRANHVFGPAGMLEQEDGENWDQSTRGSGGTVAKKYPLHYAMGLGHGEVVDDETGPPHVDTIINEHAQLWHYRAWAEWMAADSWSELKSNHSAVPTDVV